MLGAGKGPEVCLQDLRVVPGLENKKTKPSDIFNHSGRFCTRSRIQKSTLQTGPEYDKYKATYKLASGKDYLMNDIQYSF
jgi:hypothetical protein